jgi:ribosomal protein S18 acetylase RimI-like enzyme
MPVTDELLRAYDTEVRAVAPAIGPGYVVERDGPIFRTVGPNRNMIEYADLDGLAGTVLDAFIARQVAFFRDRGESFEWKTHGHDAPDDLPKRLVAAGFVALDRETVVVGRADPLAVPPEPPSGVGLRTVTEVVDLQRVADLNRDVRGDRDHERTVRKLTDDIRAGQVIVVAEAGAEMVSYGRIQFGPGRFASLWGGATRAEWRRKGIYRALVAYRARLAVARGHEIIQVDCTEDSRPILERLGMHAVTTSTPYTWSP